MLEKIKAEMLKDAQVQELLAIGATPYRDVSAEDRARWCDLFVSISMTYDLRYTEMRVLMGLDKTLGPADPPSPFGDFEKTQDVLQRIKALWDREGFGCDHDESDSLYYDLVKVIK